MISYIGFLFSVQTKITLSTVMRYSNQVAISTRIFTRQTGNLLQRYPIVLKIAATLLLRPHTYILPSHKLKYFCRLRLRCRCRRRLRSYRVQIARSQSVVRFYVFFCIVTFGTNIFLSFSGLSNSVRFRMCYLL